MFFWHEVSEFLHYLKSSYKYWSGAVILVEQFLFWFPEESELLSSAHTHKMVSFLRALHSHKARSILLKTWVSYIIIFLTSFFATSPSLKNSQKETQRLFFLLRRIIIAISIFVIMNHWQNYFNSNWAFSKIYFTELVEILYVQMFCLYFCYGKACSNFSNFTAKIKIQALKLRLCQVFF